MQTLEGLVPSFRISELASVSRGRAQCVHVVRYFTDCEKQERLDLYGNTVQSS